MEIGEPLETGAAKVIEAERIPAVAVKPVGAPGTPRITTGDEAGDAVPVPMALAARTVKV